MSVVLALLGVVASIAGIVQTVVVIIERAERKRRESQPRTLDHERSGGSPKTAPRPKSTAFDEEAPDAIGSSWRSALAYLLGFIGGLIFRRNQRPDVRFHAVQSILIDIAAVVYFLVSLVAAGAYASIRYQGTEIPSDDIIMWTWALTSILGPPALHLLLAVLALTGRRPRVPLLWKVAATATTRPAREPHQILDPADPISPWPQSRQPQRANTIGDADSFAHEFDPVWEQVKRYAGEEFRLQRGGIFRYRLHGNQVFPDRTTIGIHRTNFARAWDRRPLSGPGQISNDIIGPSYVYAILTDPRITTVKQPIARHMSTELVEERPFEPTLHRGKWAAEGGCSWHGRTCEERVVASVLTRDKGGETWHAVCQKALNRLRGS